jgi:hypothetical protein
MSEEPRTDLLGGLVERLHGLQEDVTRGMFLPADVVSSLAGQLAEPLREQAQAFERASKAFADIASLLRHQADLLDAAGSAVRAPTDVLKGIVGAPEPKTKKAPAKRAPAKRAPRARVKRAAPKRSP